MKPLREALILHSSQAAYASVQHKGSAVRLMPSRLWCMSGHLGLLCCLLEPSPQCIPFRFSLKETCWNLLLAIPCLRIYPLKLNRPCVASYCTHCPIVVCLIVCMLIYQSLKIRTCCHLSPHIQLPPAYRMQLIECNSMTPFFVSCKCYLCWDPMYIV